jgi:hypothetical protein
MRFAVATVAVPAPAARKRLGRVFGVAAGTVKRAVTVALTPHKASLKRLADMPLSVAGTGGIDFAAFHIGHGWGWLVLGASLWLIEHLISDDTNGSA